MAQRLCEAKLREIHGDIHKLWITMYISGVDIGALPFPAFQLCKSKVKEIS